MRENTGYFINWAYAYHMITQESSVEIYVVSFVEPPERLDLLENKFL